MRWKVFVSWQTAADWVNFLPSPRTGWPTLQVLCQATNVAVQFSGARGSEKKLRCILLCNVSFRVCVCVCLFSDRLLFLSQIEAVFGDTVGQANLRHSVILYTVVANDLSTVFFDAHYGVGVSLSLSLSRCLENNQRNISPFLHNKK